MIRKVLLSSTLLAAVAVVAVLSLPTASTDASGINASVFCEPGVGGAFCEAAPFNTSYSYSWTATNGLSVSGTVIGQVNCNGAANGTVTVTVTAPGIGSDSASTFISCGGPGGGNPGCGWLGCGGL